MAVLRHGSFPHRAAADDDAQSADIDLVVLSYDVGVEKPDRLIFDAAMDLYLQTCRQMHPERDGVGGERPVEMVHVSDDIGKDVLGVRDAGWGAVLLNREGLYGGNGRLGDGGVRRIGGLGGLMGWGTSWIKLLEVVTECS